MNKIFDVLDPALDLYQPLMLEASAGTGKTYSIENMVKRALTEDPKHGSPLTIKDILIVTFTKAAAKDLKGRIFQNLRKTEDVPRIKRALIEFDSANISTIHAFCYRALAENATCFRLNKTPEELSLAIHWRAIEKYFRSSLTKDNFTANQLNILLRHHRNDISLLAKALIKTQSTGVKFPPYEPQGELIDKFNKAFYSLGCSKEELLEAFKTYGYHFYGLCEGKSKILKKEHVATLADFQPSQELLDLLSLTPKKSLAKPPIDLFDRIETLLLPPLQQIASYGFLFGRLASGFQEVLHKEFEAEEACDFSYLLVKMEQLIRDDLDFKKRLQAQYRMVIIDEFQDTDPLQWKIFHELFAPSLILVGDPKQSIYAFRNADIYTYLKASQGIQAQYLLNTNYRSTPELIAALNHLFEAAPGWIALPHLKSHLPYIPVNAPRPIQSEEPAIQFLVTKASSLDEAENSLFPKFFGEVQLLQKKGIPLSQIAFLVRDHFQSDRLFHYFQSKGLSAVQKRHLTLEHAKILQDLTHLLRALKNPRHFGHLQTALGTQFFRWTAHDLEQLKDLEILREIFYLFHTGQAHWEREGIGFALETLLETPFFGPSVQEIFLGMPDGINRYHELRQIIEWLEEQQEDPLVLLEGTLEHPLRPLMDQEAVQILTLHMSKGLEFEAVFALGVINRPPLDKGPVIVRSKLIQGTNKNEYEEFQEENDAEKGRQLYVALTRAKTSLYIPVMEGIKPPLLGTASPLELWLGRIEAPLCDWKEVYKRLENSRMPLLYQLIEKCPYIKIHEEMPFEIPSSVHVTNSIQEPPSVSFAFPKQINTSFSMLAKTTYSTLNSPSDFNAPIRTTHTLPAGAHTGDLLHQLLEEIPFSADPLPYVQRTIAQTPFEPWGEVISDLITKSHAFLNVAEENCFKEMEFCYPLELAHDLPECRSLRGMMKGVIDLFFIREEKYYLLDWKSNWLGENQEAYTESQMLKSMKEHGYLLQAELYKRAACAYLAQVDGRPIDAIFGGVIYYFLRGHTYVIL